MNLPAPVFRQIVARIVALGTVACVFFVLLHLRIESMNMAALHEISDDNETASLPKDDMHFYYRRLLATYPHVRVSCLYGELQLHKSGSQDRDDDVEWQTLFSLPGGQCPVRDERLNTSEGSFETSYDYVNQNTRSKPFSLSPGLELHMFKMIEMWSEDINGLVTVPDTLTWVMELWDEATDRKLATLDSTGVYPAYNLQINGYLQSFGFKGPSAEMVTISLGPYVTKDDSRAYLTTRIVSSAKRKRANGLGIYDERNLKNNRYSTQILELLAAHRQP